MLFDKHWAGSCEISGCDTIVFTAFKKYDSGRYQWGTGYAEGIEFYKDGTAQMFSNVLCSTESSPVDFYTTAWKLKNDTLILEEHNLIIAYKIISVTKKELKLLDLGFVEKKPE